MKKIIALWMCLLLTLFTACDMQKSPSDPAIVCSGPTEFASQDALLEHLSGLDDVRHLFYLSEEFAGYPLQRIELSYAYIRCSYAASKEELSHPDTADIIVISWNYVSEGEKHLQNALKQNPDIYREIEEHPGYYITAGETVPTSNAMQTIYWVYDGCYCSVMAPADHYEAVLDEITGETPIMQRIEKN